MPPNATTSACSSRSTAATRRWGTANKPTSPRLWRRPAPTILRAARDPITTPKGVCAPADKNDEDPTAPADPDHLSVYTLRQTSPRFERVQDVTVTNQLTTHVLDIVKPDRLLVPTAKSLVGPLELPAAFGVDHFKCYRVAYEKFRAFGIKVIDQFGTITVDIKKPRHLCMPADKNGEGIPDPTQHLMCYQVRIAAGSPSVASPEAIFTNNQFGPDTYRFYGARELCVPSEVTVF